MRSITVLNAGRRTSPKVYFGKALMLDESARSPKKNKVVTKGRVLLGRRKSCAGNAFKSKEPSV